MKPILKYTLIAFFAIFIGSQITEAILLVPYWQSLSASDFYSYYNNFGHLINGFYTVLTIIAVFIPIFVLIYSKITKSKGFNFALISTGLAILFLASYYIYFKDTNNLFFKSSLNEINLKNELIIWSRWHWARITIECFSLLFLMLSFSKTHKKVEFL